MDSDPNQNGLVHYYLNDTTNFSIDEVTGEITTGMAGAPPNSSLYDFETINIYYLAVTASGTQANCSHAHAMPRQLSLSLLTCSNALPPLFPLASPLPPSLPPDNGSTPQTAQVPVVVFITDANDNPPVITGLSPASVSLSESTATMTFVSEVSFSDEDSGDNGEVHCTYVRTCTPPSIQNSLPSPSPLPPSLLTSPHSLTPPSLVPVLRWSTSSPTMAASSG